jgi:hypothetical protein
MGYFTYWKDGHPKQTVHNTIANEGHVAALDALLNAAGNIGNLYIGLIDSATGNPTAFQTLADKDWSEFTNYTEATRQLWQRGPVDGNTVPNLETKVTIFTMAADITLQGFFLTDVAEKGETTGKLLSISDDFNEYFDQYTRLYLQYTWEF